MWIMDHYAFYSLSQIFGIKLDYKIEKLSTILSHLITNFLGYGFLVYDKTKIHILKTSLIN